MGKTNFEYMSEPARAARVVEKYMKMTLREFGAVQLKGRDFVTYSTKSAIILEGLDEKKAKTMQYLAVACLLDNMDKNENYGFQCNSDDTSYSCEAFKGYAVKMWNLLLLDIYKKSIPVRLFVSLPVKAFYSYMHRRAFRNKTVQKTLFQDYTYVCSRYKWLQETVRTKGPDADKAVIKDMLQICNTVLYNPWLPTEMSLETYQKTLKWANGILESIFILSFKQVFPKAFQIENVRKAYGPEFSGTEYYKKYFEKGR